MFSKKSLWLVGQPLGWAVITPAILLHHPAIAQSKEEAPPVEEVQADSESQPDTEEMTIIGEQNELTDLVDSAKAVDLIDTEFDQLLTADIAEVMARTPGVSIRRSGGLGSETRFSLNGLTDDQVRFFVDGVPIEMSGYALGISNIPVNLIQRIEIYHGVVPLEFGADALGGAVNLKTEKIVDANGTFSHQIGDFGTQRSTLSLTHAADNGFFVRFNAFSDATDNNYEVDVEVPDERAVPQAVTVERFHDSYSAKGAIVDFGIDDKSWADLLQVTLYSSGFDKDIQHNLNMAVPYGEATFSRKNQGINLRFAKAFFEQFAVEAALGSGETETEFIDIADFSYNWLGEEIITPAPHPGEIAGPVDSIVTSDASFARIGFSWLGPYDQEVKFLLAPTWHEQSGKNHYLDEGLFDPLTAKRDLYQQVSGIEYLVDLFDQRVKNILFVKHYQMDVSSDEPVRGVDTIVSLERTASRSGWGNALRYNINEWSYAKFSYEHATRLPTPYEIFGDGVVVDPNLDLEEEVSHNYNLSYKIDNLPSPIGSWRAELNFFLRDIDNLIKYIPLDRNAIHQNFGSAKSEGVQGGAGWTSSKEFIEFDINFTSMNFVSTTEGGRFNGSRIPNVPYQYVNSSMRANWFGIFSDLDRLSFSWHARFVEAYDLIYSNLGGSNPPGLDNDVPSQLSHAVGLTFSKDISNFRTSLSAEVQNVTNEKLFDFEGVQRPGRALNIKLIVEF